MRHPRSKNDKIIDKTLPTKHASQENKNNTHWDKIIIAIGVIIAIVSVLIFLITIIIGLIWTFKL